MHMQLVVFMLYFCFVPKYPNLLISCPPMHFLCLCFKVYTVVDEMFLAGEIRETSQTKVLKQLLMLQSLEQRTTIHPCNLLTILLPWHIHLVYPLFLSLWNGPWYHLHISTKRFLTKLEDCFRNKKNYTILFTYEFLIYQFNPFAIASKFTAVHFNKVMPHKQPLHSIKFFLSQWQQKTSHFMYVTIQYSHFISDSWPPHPFISLRHSRNGTTVTNEHHT